MTSGVNDFVWGLAGFLLCLALVRIRRVWKGPVIATPIPAGEDNDWQVSISVLEFNCMVSRMGRTVGDVRDAIRMAANLVEARALTVKDAEVLERNQAKLTIVNGRLVAKAEEIRRMEYLRARTG